MGAHVVTKHPRPFSTDLQNYKQIREEIILSFNKAQQQFLLKHKWNYRKEKRSTDVKISFAYHFSQREDTVFRLLFSNYKLFNYCKHSVNSYFNSFNPTQTAKDS